MLNILDLTLLSLTILIVFLGSLITNFEKHMPISLVKFYRYGSFGYKGSAASYLQSIELPKSYFRHFYAFSAILSSVTLIYMCMVYFLQFNMNKYITLTLELMLEQKESSVSATGAFIALSLVTGHCIRRCYESHRLQVFASSGKINMCHYGTAYVHYTILIIATVGQAPLFCGSQNRSNIIWTNTWTKLVAAPCIIVFLLASYEQWASNVILASLRKDKKTGAVITEEHGIPRGRLFESVSSPHRLCEVVLYSVLAILLPTKTMFIMWVWVLSNQVQSAVHAHEWYIKTFKDYPARRTTIFPRVL